MRYALRSSVVIVLLAALGVMCQSAPTASAPVLGVRGTTFTVDGTPRFLIFYSYFDGLRRAAHGAAGLEKDFRLLGRAPGTRGQRVDGIRVLVNWQQYRCSAPSAYVGDSLFVSRGTPPDTRWERSEVAWRRLLDLLEAAGRHHLLVDLTFTRDNVRSVEGPMAPGLADALPAADATRLIAAVARDLRGRAPHALFDVQNEFNIRSKLRLSPVNEVGAMLDAVRAADPSRLTGASFSRDTALSRRVGGNVILFHDAREMRASRSAVWYSDEAVARAVRKLRPRGAPARPIDYQEPMPLTVFPGCPGAEHDPDPEHMLAALRAAKAHGVGAWTLHSRTGFDLAAQPLADRLDADPKHVERDLLSRLRSAVDGGADGP